MKIFKNNSGSKKVRENMSKKFISFVDEGLLNMTYTSRLQSYLKGNVVDVNPFDLFDVETPWLSNPDITRKIF
ncbi:hypothetical protein [uncultured Finegoldia sp.]|uniref:hypothetical protein n=1 Tax=uncultured Finegoldia sp. TaxID=328009 RepID=UPI0025F756DA|nr:hypothetical protein [uncultured Finegoldia sp.]MDU1832230.1 hypothetical protein [Finegoldia magna]MDU1879090.1 hypothetical protein [Finegoldia magna]